MRFLVDECTGPAVARWLRREGHEVFSVFEQAKGIDDDAIIEKALAERWILVTNDKDFGAKVYRDGRLHRGVILLRLQDDRAPNKIDTMARIVRDFAVRLEDSFLVATEKTVRFAQRRG